MMSLFVQLEDARLLGFGKEHILPECSGHDKLEYQTDVIIHAQNSFEFFPLHAHFRIELIRRIRRGFGVATAETAQTKSVEEMSVLGCDALQS